MENNDIFLTGADINDERNENENEVIEQKDMNQIDENKEENPNETTDKKEIDVNLENENVNENETNDKKESNPEVQNENENEKVNENENEINKEIKTENENENETEKKETNNELENENKTETPEQKEPNNETENENEKNENNKETENEEEKINETQNKETENTKENETLNENTPIDSIKNKGSPFLTEALDNINEEIKEEINPEENKNIKKEEEKEKVGQYYFPMIINRYKKENYSSAGYLFKHPQRPIDTSKKINFKTNPGLCRGPVKMNFKPKRDITPINDLMNYLQEIFHIPPVSRSVSIPYDNFRERMKMQFLSRNPHVFGNFKFPPKNIVYHSIDSNYREDKIIKARNIAMVKLPKIKQVYNYSSQDNIHKNDVKNYSISKPF